MPAGVSFFCFVPFGVVTIPVRKFSTASKIPSSGRGAAVPIAIGSVVARRG